MLNLFLNNQLKNKPDLLLGHVTFFILIIFSILYLFERTLYVDSAYQLFEIIKRCGFQQNVRRYSMFFSELLPLLAINLKLPLKIVVITYSLSFTFIGYGFWLLTTYVLKNRYVGIIMLLTMIGMRHTFFHTLSETFQLMFFGAFLYAWLASRFAEKKETMYQILYYSITLFMMALCMFIHPVALFFLIFITGVYMLNNTFTIQQKVIIALFTVGILVLKYVTIVPGSHDTDYNLGLKEFLGYCLTIYKIRSTEWFFVHFIDFYWAPVLLLVVALIHYKRRKQYLNFCFFLGFNLFFMVVTLVLYHEPDSAFGRERSFLPLMFFCGIPFMRDTLPTLSIKWNKIFLFVLSFLIAIGFLKIAVASIPYTKRVKVIDEIVSFAKQNNQQKLIMDKEMSHTIFPFYNWATGFESMFYSAIKDKNAVVNFYIEENLTQCRNDERYLNEEFYLAVPWWTFWWIKDLNPHYFKLPSQPVKELIVEDGKFVIKELNYFR